MDARYATHTILSLIRVAVLVVVIVNQKPKTVVK